jgi:hypothetical protein
VRFRAAKRAYREEEEASAQRAVAAEALMYAADANPFNDADLGSRFKWGKKEEKEKKQGISRVEADRRDAERRREAQVRAARAGGEGPAWQLTHVPSAGRDRTPQPKACRARD